MFDKIKLSYPNIWIKDTDFGRMIDIITSTIDREFYIVDFEKGFSKLVDGEWKSILVPNPSAEMTGGPSHIVTHELSIALPFLMDEHKDNPTRKTFFINVIGDPNAITQMLGGYLSFFKDRYRKAFWQDDLDVLPIQFIFLSSQDCPEMYLNFVHVMEQLYPNPVEITQIVQHINSCSHDRVINDDIKDIVNVGVS